VGEIQHRCTEAGLTYDQASHMTNNELRELLYPDSFGKKSSAPDPPWKDIHRVLQSRDNRKKESFLWTGSATRWTAWWMNPQENC